MLIAATFTQYRSAPPAAQPTGRDIAQVGPNRAETGGELLSTFLSSDTLLWACIAVGLIALVTISRVVSRRRETRKVSRTVRAQAKAVHDFLSSVRASQSLGADAMHAQGLWHYDFLTGEQQFTDEFNRLVMVGPDGCPDQSHVDDALNSAGIDLPAIARKHSDQTAPYEVRFALEGHGAPSRMMVFKACNMRNGKGEVQRLIAVMHEADNSQNS